MPVLRTNQTKQRSTGQPANLGPNSSVLVLQRDHKSGGFDIQCCHVIPRRKYLKLEWPLRIALLHRLSDDILHGSDHFLPPQSDYEERR